MRRSTVALTCAAAVALTLSACSSSSDDAAAAASGADGEETVTVTGTMLGDVEVPAEPERVLGLWNTGNQLYELGITPVGVLEGEYVEEEYPDDYAELAQIPTVGTWESIDVEAIIELEPDLIVTFDNGQEWDYDALSAIAPTVAFEVVGPSGVWDAYEDLAFALGKQDRYAELAKGYDDDFAAIAAEHGEELADVQVMYVYSYMEGSAYLYTSRALAAPRIQAAGFAYDTSWDEKAEWWGYDLDFELLDELSHIDVFFYPANDDGTAEDELTQALLDEPAFQALPAVEAGHVYPYRDLFVYTFAAATRQADDIAAAAKQYLATR